MIIDTHGHFTQIPVQLDAYRGRQIMQLSPSRLVLFEMSEIALYTIERELCEIASRDHLTVEVVPLLGNAHHRQRVREVLAAYSVQLKN